MPSADDSLSPAGATPAGSDPTAIDALLILFEALPEELRERAYQRLTLAHVRHKAGVENDTARMLRSLARVGEVVGEMPPNSTQYKRVSGELIRAGEDIVPFNQLYHHFGRSWPNVTEAAGMAPVSTPRKIEARFLARRLGRPSSYSDTTLTDALSRCSAWFTAKDELSDGRRAAPLRTEYTWWRERELELARARGDLLFRLPSAYPYCDRHGSWDQVLAHFGFTSQEIAERHDRVTPPSRVTTPVHLTPAGLPLAELTDQPPADLDADAALLLKSAWHRLTPRSRYVLTARLGLAGQPSHMLREIGAALNLHISSVHGIQTKALASLTAALPTDLTNDRQTHARDLLHRLATHTTTTS